jgi:thiol-disulfide isomerase/thioredoxin
MSSKQIVTCFESRDDFLNLLRVNTGLIVIKMGADWCKPCKTIKPIVQKFFLSSPDNVICCDINVDDSIDLYSVLKTKRIINGIPVMLAYKKGNVSYFPDASVTGVNPKDIDYFFKECGNLIKG